MENLADKLKGILAEHAPEAAAPAANVSPQACWFNGDVCPYGLPNGNFKDRPSQFCHLGKGGCPKLVGFAAGFDEFGCNYFED